MKNKNLVKDIFQQEGEIKLFNGKLILKTENLSAHYETPYDVIITTEDKPELDFRGISITPFFRIMIEPLVTMRYFGKTNSYSYLCESHADSKCAAEALYKIFMEMLIPVDSFPFTKNGAWPIFIINKHLCDYICLIEARDSKNEECSTLYQNAFIEFIKETFLNKVDAVFTDYVNEYATNDLSVTGFAGCSIFYATGHGKTGSPLFEVVRFFDNDIRIFGFPNTHSIFKRFIKPLFSSELDLANYRFASSEAILEYLCIVSELANGTSNYDYDSFVPALLRRCSSVKNGLVISTIARMVLKSRINKDIIDSEKIAKSINDKPSTCVTINPYYDPKTDKYCIGLFEYGAQGFETPQDIKFITAEYKTTAELQYKEGLLLFDRYIDAFSYIKNLLNATIITTIAIQCADNKEEVVSKFLEIVPSSIYKSLVIDTALSISMRSIDINDLEKMLTIGQIASINS